MNPPILLLGGALLLGGVVLVLRARRVEPATLRLVAPNIWVLDHLCRSAGAILRSGPAPKRVTIDLTNIAYIDESGMASLDYACRRWTAAGVHVTIEGCDHRVAEDISRRSIRAEVQRKPRISDSPHPTTLH